MATAALELPQIEVITAYPSLKKRDWKEPQEWTVRDPETAIVTSPIAARFQPDPRLSAELAEMGRRKTSQRGFNVGCSWSPFHKRLVIWETYFELSVEGIDKRMSAMMPELLRQAAAQGLFIGRETYLQLWQDASRELCPWFEGMAPEIRYVLCAEDGGPRDIERWDLNFWDQLDTEGGEDTVEKWRKHNEALDAFQRGQQNDRDDDLARFFASTAVSNASPRSVRTGTSSQYVCAHGRRNVSCPICKPNKKLRFFGGQKSGSENTGYETVNLKEHGMEHLVANPGGEMRKGLPSHARPRARRQKSLKRV